MSWGVPHATLGPRAPVRPLGIRRASLIRHAAICVAALTAYLFHQQLRVSNAILWIFALSVLLNLATTHLSERPRFQTLARNASPLFGIGGWTGLVFLTGGVTSPFLAGFALEIIISALTFGPRGTALVTFGATGALVAQQLLLGTPSLRLLSLHGSFILATGVLTFLATRHWERTQEGLAHKAIHLEGRLRTLEEELEDTRTLGQVGENAARVAHALKNTTHSLRGFAALIDRHVPDHGTERRALDGLHDAIERLEEVARSSLGSSSSTLRAGREDGASGSDVLETLEEILDEVRLTYPGIRWVNESLASLPDAAVSAGLIREVLRVLTQNAGEACDGQGTVQVRAAAAEGKLRIEVEDQGPGITDEEGARLFKAGYTTKRNGSGFGLYLTRRLVEAHGGTLRARTAPGGGALFAACVPLQERAGNG